MSYWVNKIGNNNNANHKEFYCDKRTDIKNLPTLNSKGKNGDSCSVGSECLCLEDSSVWILGKDNNQWIELGV